MVFVPVPNVVQANIRTTIATEQVENILYFRAESVEVNDSSMGALGLELINWWENNLSSWLTTAIELREVYLTDLSTQDGPTVTVTPSNPPVQGIDADPVLPNNCALCVSFRTGKRGRSFRGRNYVAGLGEGRVTASIVDTTYAEGIRDAYNLLLAPIALPPGWRWVVVSRIADKQPRTVGEATNITSVVLTDRVMDSQRRRLPGRGR
jgi:hypothetical protein